MDRVTIPLSILTGTERDGMIEQPLREYIEELLEKEVPLERISALTGLTRWDLEKALEKKEES